MTFSYFYAILDMYKWILLYPSIKKMHISWKKGGGYLWHLLFLIICIIIILQLMASLPFPGMIPTRRVSCALFIIILYKIKDSADAQKFAIDIKEHARDLKNVIASLSTGDSLAEAFQKKIAVSDQDDIVDADYVGNGDSGENTNSFQMEIKKLASPQLNYGSLLLNQAVIPLI